MLYIAEEIEGGIAILIPLCAELKRTEKPQAVPLTYLPKGIKEGDVIKKTIDKTTNKATNKEDKQPSFASSFVIDTELTQKRLKEVQKRLDIIFRKG